jgi:choline monooxygenase
VNAVEAILGEEAIAALRRPIETARGLPPPAYTSREFFELERTKLFPRNWISIGFAHEVPDPGDAVPMTAAGLPVIAVRDRAGELRVFHNACTHRASLILREPVKGCRTLQCPYHCWTFGLDGRLVATPYWDGTKDAAGADLDREARALQPVRAAVWNGILFVNLDGKAPPFADTIRPLDAFWSGYDLSRLKPGFTRTWDTRANWKLYFENFENFHEQWVHAGIIPLRLDKRRAAKSYEEVWDGSYFGLVNPTAAWEDDLQHGLPLIPGQDPNVKENRSSAYVIGVFPNTSLALKTNHLMVSVWIPLAADRVASKVAWFFQGEAATDAAYTKNRQGVIDRWIAVRSQDLAIFEGQQIARASPVASRVIFAPFWEELIWRFQNRIVDELERA